MQLLNGSYQLQKYGGDFIWFQILGVAIISKPPPDFS
jgi:hypothetical protein